MYGARAILGDGRSNLAQGKRDSIAKLLEIINDTVFSMANAVNGGAERVGCNYVEEPSHG